MTNTSETPEARLLRLRLELPPPPKPAGIYRPLVISGSYAYLSGTGPYMSDGSYLKGRVGVDLDVAAGKRAARQTGLAILAILRDQLKTLDRIERIVKVLGMVNAPPEFGDHPSVINGFSELMVEVFGPDRGTGARSAVGMASLPKNIPVEIEAIFELR